MKKGKLSIVEKTFIENKSTIMSTEEMASVLDRKTETVQKYLDTLSEKAESGTDNTAPTQRKDRSNIAYGKNFGVMTPGASDMVDLARKVLPSEDDSSYIFKPKG